MLVINLKADKLLGLTIPPSLLARADQVIQLEVTPLPRLAAPAGARARRLR